MQNVVGLTLVAMGTKFRPVAEIQSPTGLYIYYLMFRVIVSVVVILPKVEKFPKGQRTDEYVTTKVMQFLPIRCPITVHYIIQLYYMHNICIICKMSYWSNIHTQNLLLYNTVI